MSEDTCPFRDFLNHNNCLLTDRDCITSHPNKCRGFKLQKENAKLKRVKDVILEAKENYYKNWLDTIIERDDLKVELNRVRELYSSQTIAYIKLNEQIHEYQLEIEELKRKLEEMDEE